MIKIDLITGFLGSGKTTFIKKYARCLMERGCRIGILENDYGAVNVDMLLLQELEGEQCELEMIAGGCDRETHRRRFRTKLIAMGMLGYDRVLVEPSGIYDVDEFFDTLCESPLDQWYEPGNVIAIVDAKLEEQLSSEAEFLLASEVANAGCVVLSKSQNASQEEIRATLAHLNRALGEVQCSRRIAQDEVLCRDWETFTEKEYERIVHCGHVLENYRKQEVGEDGGFQSLYFMNVQMTERELCDAVKKMWKDTSCGTIFRVKGFLKNAENQWAELNATRDEISVKPIQTGQEILIVIGEDLVQEAIAAYFRQESAG